MYMRFVSALRHRHCTADEGIIESMRRVHLCDQPLWVRRNYWATRQRVERLDVPYVLINRCWHRRDCQSLCWLKPEAEDYLSYLRYLAWRMTEVGVPIREIRTRKPGVIFWKDAHQIVAKPERRHTPRAF